MPFSAISRYRHHFYSALHGLYVSFELVDVFVLLYIYVHVRFNK